MKQITIASYQKTLDVLPIEDVVCFLLHEDKVLLGLRNQTSNGLGEGRIQGIGGKVEIAKGETPEQAVVREFREETGVELTAFEPRGCITFLFPSKPKWNQHMHIFVATAFEGEPKEIEAIRPIWFDVKSLPLERMWDDTTYWLPQVLAGQNVTATILYGEDNATVVEQLF